MNRRSEFTNSHNFRVFVGTWNVNGGKQFRSVIKKHASITDWLLDLPKSSQATGSGFVKSLNDDSRLVQPMDVCAIGFEEIVDLTASNIVGGSKTSANQSEWGQYLQFHLNRDMQEKDAYILVTSVQLVGVCLFLFVRSRLAEHVRMVSSSSVKTGLGGAAGNKGAVAIRFQVIITLCCLRTYLVPWATNEN